MIDAGLAADRGIDLRQQRRRHLDETDAAHVTRCRKTRDVADHAATERDHRGVALCARLDEPIENRLHRGQGLVRLAVGQRDARDVAAFEVREQLVQIERLHGLVRNDEAVVATQMLAKVEVAAEQAATDNNGIAAVPEFDSEGGRHAQRVAQSVA